METLYIHLLQQSYQRHVQGVYLYTKLPNVTETGDRLLPYGSGTLHLPGLEIDRPREPVLKDYLLTF